MATIKLKKKEMEILEGLPGLKIDRALKQGRGSDDAVAAARFRLGLDGGVSGGLPAHGSVAIGLKPSHPDHARLRKYQRDGVRFLVNTVRRYGGAILADDMGLGKTYQTMCATKFLCGPDDRILVSCPGAVRETWRDELAKWGFESVAVLTPQKSSWKDASTAKVVVCSHDYRLMERAVAEVFAEVGPRVLIIDEAHRLRGRKSKRADVFSELGALVPYKIALSGTPQADRPKNWWQLLHILFGYSFGSQWDFDKAYCGARPNPFGGLLYPKKGSFHAEEFKLRLGYYMLRREKSEVAQELPPMTVQVRWVEPTQEAKSAWIHSQIGVSRESTVHNAIVATLKGKTDEAIQLAVESKRFLLATWLRDHARSLAKTLITEHETPCVCITGDMPPAKRQGQIRLAIASGWGIVATTECVAEGLNIQGAASVGILHALDWMPLRTAQLLARLHRLGQTDPVQWYLLAMRDTVDRAIIETQLSKLEQWTSTMGGSSNRNIKHALGDAIHGAEAKKIETKALTEIYEAMR